MGEPVVLLTYVIVYGTIGMYAIFLMRRARRR